jgi:hypothetical protein
VLLRDVDGLPVNRYSSAGSCALVVGLTLGCGGHTESTDGSPSGSPDVSAVCADYCAHYRAVGCGNPLTGCEQDCVDFFDVGPIAACRHEFAAGYSCQAAQPTADFVCSEGGVPFFQGTGCSAQGSAAAACLDASLPPALPGCLRYCEFDAEVCGHDLEYCQDACRIIGVIPGCEEEFTRHRDCIAALPASALVCRADMLEAADGSCEAEDAALEQCFDAN